MPGFLELLGQVEVVAPFLDARVVIGHDHQVSFLGQLQRLFHVLFVRVEGGVVEDEVGGVPGHGFAEHMRVAVEILTQERIRNALFDDQDLLILGERQKFLGVAHNKHCLVGGLAADIHGLLAQADLRGPGRIVLAGLVEESLVVFHIEEAAAGVVDALFGELALFHGHLDAEEALAAGFVVGLEEDGVHAGPDGHGAGLGQRPLAQDGGHADGVGDDDALEAQLLSEQAGEHLVRQGRGELVVVGRIDGVGGHDGLGARLDGGVEGDQFHLVHAFPVRLADVQDVVRVGGGVAAACKMLGRGHHARVLVAAHRGFHVPGADRRVVAEGAYADFRVERVDVDVAHRVVELGHADGGHHLTQGVGDLVCQVGIADGGQAHGRNELADAAGGVVVLEVAFHVNRDMKGNTGRALQGDFLQLVDRFRVFRRRDAHTVVMIVEVRAGDVDVILGRLETGIDLRMAPVEVLAGFQAVRLQAEAAGVKLGNLLDPRGGQVGAAPSESEQLTASFGQRHIGKFS